MRFVGHVQATHSLRHAMVSGGTPTIQIDVVAATGAAEVAFLIDTGADATVLHPRDAHRILGDDLATIDFAADSRRAPGLGVGGDADRVVRNATLTLRSVDGEPYSLDMPILIARPTPAEPGEHGNWRLPSLLGRDFLRHFRLELLCGEQRRVMLEAL